MKMASAPNATRLASRLSCALGLGILAGCAAIPSAPPVSSAEVEAYVSSRPASLARLYRQVPLQGRRNLVLNQMRAGAAALDAGELDAAAASFDEALQVIETIYAENPSAERARSVWYAENIKDFKGEAYERAMAYYYRGIIYMMQGDFQNARASFRGGLLTDSFMEENARMAADFGALAFLEGWAGRCAGFDPATTDASFNEAASRNGALQPPPPMNTMLVLFETGTGPLKLTRGRRNEVLAYAPGPVAPLRTAMVSYGVQQNAAVQAENIFFQATTRSGRAVDEINQGKVVYQDNTRTAGVVAVSAGAGLLAASRLQSNQNAAAAMAVAGGLVMLAGFAAQVAADAMITEADARHWDNLPGNILVTTFLRQPPAPSETRSGGGRARAVPPSPLSEVQVAFERTGTSPGARMLPIRGNTACSVAWGREVRADAVADVAPHSVRVAR
jgi:tetratricopeptide (TPR) repeat protein